MWGIKPRVQSFRKNALMDLRMSNEDTVGGGGQWSLEPNQEVAAIVSGYVCNRKGFPGGSLVKEPICNAGDTGLIPGLGKSPRAENGKPDKYSCLGNSMERGAWRATVHAVTKEADMT